MSRPPYVLLGNGSVALRFLEAMVQLGYPPTLVVLNDPDRQREGEAIRAASTRHGVPVGVWGGGGREQVAQAVAVQPEAWLVSVYFGHRLDDDLLAAAGHRAVNLHASLLPWNRGVHTNVWPIVERAQAGVSLHVMTPQVDRGALLAQTEVRVEPWDTGASLYRKLEDEGLRLLTRCWPDVVVEAWPGQPQPEGGSEHRLADFARLASFDVDSHPDVRRFYDLLRARSFPPFPGLTVKVDGVEVEATVTLKPSHG